MQTDNCITKVSSAAGPDNQPRWSPDGNSIAFITAAAEEAPPQLVIAPAKGGPATQPVPSLDLIPTDLQWATDGALYFDTGVKGEFQLFKIDVAAHRLSQVTTGSRAVRSPNIAASGHGMVYLVNDFTHLDDVYSAALDGKSGEEAVEPQRRAAWRSSRCRRCSA